MYSCSTAEAGASTASDRALIDPFVDRVLALAPAPALGDAGRASARAVSDPAFRMPGPRTEAYRFTDISPLLSRPLVPPPEASPARPVSLVSAAAARQAPAGARPADDPSVGRVAVLVDGRLDAELSDLSNVPAGVFVGPLSSAPAEVVAAVGAGRVAPDAPDAAGTPGGAWRDLGADAPGYREGAVVRTPSADGLDADRGAAADLPFAALSAAAARDVLAVRVPDGVDAGHLHVLCLTSGAEGGGRGLADPAGGGGEGGAARGPPLLASFPRVAARLGPGASLTLVEEHAPAHGPDGRGRAALDAAAYWTSPATEARLDAGASLVHCVAQADAVGSAHTRATVVAQAAGSSYRLTEALTGASLSRHDLRLFQTGPGTDTELRHFVLASAGQTGDLSTGVDLAHPDSTVRQIHKAIAADPDARSVFDGAVRVRRPAQRTDAGQLTRSLLLAPRARVHARPCLRIEADDVACTHGCSVSDLDAEQLFYLEKIGRAHV